MLPEYICIASDEKIYRVSVQKLSDSFIMQEVTDFHMMTWAHNMVGKEYLITSFVIQGKEKVAANKVFATKPMVGAQIKFSVESATFLTEPIIVIYQRKE